MTGDWSLDKRISPEPMSGCWLWTGKRNPYGYGIVAKKYSEKQAHRVVYEMLRDPIPVHLQADHLCRVRACVNPFHIEIVSQQVNLARGHGVAARNARKTHCPYGHSYTPENVYRRPGSPNSRECRVCHDARNRSRYLAAR